MRLPLSFACFAVFASQSSQTAIAQGYDVALQAAPDTEVGPLDGARVTGWYVAPSSGVTSLEGDLGYVAGLRAAVMLDRRVGIGVAGNALATGQTRLGERRRRDVGVYGGLYFQYRVLDAQRFHGYADATIGLGTWCPGASDARCASRDFVFAEPAVNAEVDVAAGVKLALGIGYRAARVGQPGEGRGGDRDRGLSGPVARATLALGAF
jgi:hypothetical protein